MLLMNPLDSENEEATKDAMAASKLRIIFRSLSAYKYLYPHGGGVLSGPVFVLTYCNLLVIFKKKIICHCSFANNRLANNHPLPNIDREKIPMLSVTMSKATFDEEMWVWASVDKESRATGRGRTNLCYEYHKLALTHFKF